MAEIPSGCKKAQLQKLRVGLAKNSRWRCKKTLTTLLTILACYFVSSNVLGSTIVPCKYSVRDVAFVNVHGKSWQLQLIKPDDVEPKIFAQWNNSLRAKLENSNVGHVWLDPDSEQATRMQNANSKLVPPMALVGPDGVPISVSTESGTTFCQSLDSILSSPAREKILDRVVESLCVFVLVESGDEKLDVLARSSVNAAIERMKTQMWTLEKPTDKGPVLVTISNEQKTQENWLLQSIGIDKSDVPAVAIIYGQGRRLGEVLGGDDINLKTLVGRASICGQDCECDLNRQWLYGAQVIHVWSNQQERAAESSLSFDPKSAFVIAEVAQIIQKNSGRNLRQNSGQSQVDLGGGLIIHDLDQSSTSTQIEPPESKEQSNELAGDNEAAKENSDIEIQSRESSADSTADATPGISIPWTLLAGLAAVTIFVFVLRLRG